MAIPSRQKRIPGTYFVTSRTWQSRHLFVVDAACTVFVETLLAYRKDCAFELHAFVLMPDHFHVLLTPAPDKTLERAVQLIKGGSARRLGLQRKLSFPVWQRGFSDHRIRDMRDYMAHVQYIDRNPVRKQLVQKAGDHQWSSACGTYLLDEAPRGLKALRAAGILGTAEAVP
jgi:putative transposase